jgi:type VI secretion system protein ImpG
VSVQGALRIRLRTRDVTFAQLPPIEHLTFYLSGEEQIANHLFELVQHGVGALVGRPNAMANAATVTDGEPVSLAGFDPSRPRYRLRGTSSTATTSSRILRLSAALLLLPVEWTGAGLAAIDGREAEIVVLLSRAPLTSPPMSMRDSSRCSARRYQPVPQTFRPHRSQSSF